MTKKEIYTALSELHSKVMDLQDEATEAWRETLDEEDEKFFQQAGELLSDLDESLGAFLDEHNEERIARQKEYERMEDIKNHPENYSPEEVKESEAYFKDIEDMEKAIEEEDDFEDELYTEMDEDPEEFFRKNMESED